MTKDIAISVQNIHKDFILPQHKNTTFKQTVVNIVKKNKKVTQKVLDGVSFDVYKGDFFGIVGRNGSGKSTLLKLIAGVYTPTAGHIEINGGLTPFIELGVGFNPELSGRDNVFLNGALLGFDNKQMNAMYDEIVEFAELEPFMDQKLKNYSSGMQVRLAFSIAIKAKNEILIFDEVLAVGDEAFQSKCLSVFEKYKATKQTVILVTHDMAMVKKFCNRAILLCEGKIIETGNPHSVADEYSRLNQINIDKGVESQNVKTNELHNLKVNIASEKGVKRHSFALGEKAVFDISWVGLPVEKIESIGVNIFKKSGEHITGINSRRFFGYSSKWKEKGYISIEFDLDISPGRYYVLVEVFDYSGKVEESILEGPEFSVVNQEMKWSGLVEMSHRWIEK
jgi:ABC-type polysaccharide/polyol phosphate transport system ATPase subunit